MSKRRTYSDRRTYSAKVMRFRLGVYSARGDALTPGCQLLLLRLSDDMDARGYVSVPRSQLAEDLAAPLPRITEWVKEAIDARFLDRVRRGQPGVTAVYQGLIRTPAEVRPSVPSQRYATADHAGVRPGVPTSEPTRYAQGGSHEVETSRSSEATVPARTNRAPKRSSDEGQEPHGVAGNLLACEAHGWGDCQDRECIELADRRGA